MTVLTSRTAGLTWEVFEHIDTGPSGYVSAITLLASFSINRLLYLLLNCVPACRALSS